MSEFTQGTWVFDPTNCGGCYNRGFFGLYAEDDCGNYIREVAGVWRQAKSGGSSWDDSEAEANARLIAAAPDFYKAINGIPDDVSPLGWLRAVIEHYGELLAKSIEAGDEEDPEACHMALGEVKAMFAALQAATAKADGRATR